MKKQKSFVVIGLVALLGLAPLTAAKTMSVKPNGCKGPTLCDASPVIDGCGWHLGIGLLLEQMRVGNANYFYEHAGDAATDATFSNPSEFDRVYNLKFNVDPGVRASIGYYDVHDDWMIKASFEWLHSKATNNAETTVNEGGFYPSYMVNLFYTDTTNLLIFGQAESSLSINYYLLDIAVSKGSYFSNHFSFEPLGGIKVSWIGYDGRLSLSNNLNGAVTFPSNTSWLRRSFIDFWGIGPMVGFKSNYHMFVGWSIFADVNAAILLGETKIRDGIGFVTIEKLPFTNLSWSNIDVITPTIRTMIGLQYDMDMFKETQHLFVKLGFDGRLYYNQFPTISRPAIRTETTNGNLLRTSTAILQGSSFGMVGFVLDVGWDY